MSKPGPHARVRGHALAEAGKLARVLPTESRQPVREAAETALHDDMYFVRLGAIRSLQRLGDPGAIAPLRDAVARDVEGAVRLEARVAIEKLRSGDDHESALKQLREEVEALGRRETELRDRIGRLEPAPKASRAARKKPAARRR
jgi:HEAT repeat protein